MAKIKYGTTLWGAAFLDSIEQRTDDGRLSRGRSYANTGKVYDISLASNRISAKVKGNYKPFYKTQLTFNEFPKGDKKFIIDYIEHNPLILAQIINSKLSSEILEYLQKNEIDLFRDFSMHCSCPDFYGAYPCKHIAGLYYILVKEIDKNPFILFSLHGLDLVEHFHIKKNLEIPYPLPIEYQTALQKSDITAQEMQMLQLEPQKEFILSMLESNPPFAPIDYKTVFEQFYTAIAKKLPLTVSITHDEKITHIQQIFQSATILCKISHI